MTRPTLKSKNWSMVRAYTGWRRYDTDEELEALKSLLELITIRHNLFMPHMKLSSRQRERGKVHKTYDMDIPLKQGFKKFGGRGRYKREAHEIQKHYGHN